MRSIIIPFCLLAFASVSALAGICDQKCYNDVSTPCKAAGTKDGICRDLREKCEEECEEECEAAAQEENNKDIIDKYNITETDKKTRYIDHLQGGSYKTYYRAYMTVTVTVKALGVKSGKATVTATGRVSYNQQHAYRALPGGKAFDLTGSAKDTVTDVIYIKDGIGEGRLYFTFDVREKNWQTYQINEYYVDSISGEVSEVMEWQK